jgi:hypothetical protein
VEEERDIMRRSRGIKGGMKCKRWEKKCEKRGEERGGEKLKKDLYDRQAERDETLGYN